MNALATFNIEALAVVRAQIERLRSELSFAQALALPQASAQDIVIAGKEVQLTIYKQTELGFLKGDVLVTVQLARFGLGGTSTYQAERGLVFSPNYAPRDATESELSEQRSS